MATLHHDRLPNGLRLLAEERPAAQSTALTLFLPAGVATEPDDGQGFSALLAELIFRGAGQRDARAHSDALDRLGVQRDAGVGVQYLHLGATALASKFDAALPLILDMVLRPVLPGESLDAAKELALQALASLDDEPQQKAMERLHERHEPPPLNRSSLGRRADIEGATIEALRADWRRRFVPDGAILGVAGRVDPPRLRDRLEALCAGWAGALEPAEPGAPAARGAWHEREDSQQAHIGLAWDAPPEPDPERPYQEAATAVLSGGTSGRLFHEARERRGLCYSVSARYAGDRDRGAVLCYAGTTPERAQETLDVVLAEVARLRRGVTADELKRALAGLKARLVIQGESTPARAAALAQDQHLLGRPRSRGSSSTP